MMTLNELERYLREQRADFELIRQEKPIRSAADAAGIYPVEKSAPHLILETDRGLWSCIHSPGSGRLDFAEMKAQFGCLKMKLAGRDRILKATGCEVGSIPLVGLGLPCIFDDALLQFDYVYGGTGDELVTLKIRPLDARRLNRIIGEIGRDA